MKKNPPPATPEPSSPAFDAVMSMISEAVIMVQDRQITYVSPKAMEIFGVSNPKAMLGNSTRILFFSDEEFQEFGRNFYRRIKEQGFFSGMINLKRLSDGSPVQISWHSKILDNDKQIVVAVIKENKYSLLPPEIVFKETKVDFEEKVSEFSQILDSLDMAVVTINADGDIDYSNAMMNNIVASHPTGRGAKCYETCEHIWSESGEDFCSWCHIHDVMHSGHPKKSIVKSVNNKQWLFSWAPIFGKDRTTKKVVKTITDITSQISDSKYLETLLFDLFSAMPIGIVIYNGKGNIIFLNATMEERWGLTYSEVAMTNLLELERCIPEDNILLHDLGRHRNPRVRIQHLHQTTVIECTQRLARTRRQ